MVASDELFHIAIEAYQEGKCREQNGTGFTKPILWSCNVMCPGYHNLDTALCYTTMCTALNSPNTSVPSAHDESNKFPLKSIHTNSCLWLTRLPQLLAPPWGTAFSVSIGKYQVKYGNLVLQSDVRGLFQRNQTFAELISISGTCHCPRAPTWNAGSPWWSGMGRKCSQKSKTAVQELGTNLKSKVLIKSFCDIGSHRHWNLSKKPLLRMVLKFLDYFISVEAPGPSSTSWGWIQSFL